MKKSIILIIFLLVGFLFCSSQTIKVNGKLILQNEEDREAVIKKTKIILEQNGIKQTGFINKKLEFNFDINGLDRFQITAIPQGVGSVSGRIYQFKNTELRKVDTISIKFPYSLTCKYDKSINNKICPVCKKEDEVIPVKYGLIAETSKKNNDNENKRYKSGGCVISDCDPNWYCKRDNIDF